MPDAELIAGRPHATPARPPFLPEHAALVRGYARERGPVSATWVLREA